MKQYDKIIFVCENGTARAPMAEAILKEYRIKYPVEIESRGLVVLFPEPLNQKVEAVLISNGINIDHKTVTFLHKDSISLAHPPPILSILPHPPWKLRHIPLKSFLFALSPL